MSPPPRDALIAEVLANLAKPVGRLAFTPSLEEHYRASIAPDKRRSMIIGTMIGLAVLVAFVLMRSLVLEIEDPERFRAWLGAMAAITAVCAVGLVVSIFQAATQINEATLSFVPKVVAAVAVLGFAGPWMMTTLVEYLQRTLQSIPSAVG